MPARPGRRSFEAVQMSSDPSAVARAERWNVGFRSRAVASRLRWAVLIPTAALGFTAAAALGHSGSKADPPASFFGAASTATPQKPRLGNADGDSFTAVAVIHLFDVDGNHVGNALHATEIGTRLAINRNPDQP
jgi:hypothetical protein